MGYVRQHYNLATTGKLGQKASGRTAPKGGNTKSSTSSSEEKRSSSSSNTKKSGY